jgi:thymidylate kinase
MHQQIIFTPADLMEVMKSVCYLITLIAAVVGIIAAAVTKAKAPDRSRDRELEEHEKRLDELEKTRDEFKEFFRSDSDRFIRLENDTRIYQRGLLALINHSIDGNNIRELEKCRDELTEVIYKVKEN